MQVFWCSDAQGEFGSAIAEFGRARAASVGRGLEGLWDGCI